METTTNTNWYQLLQARIDALNNVVHPEQEENLLEWIVRNVPRDYWLGAALDAEFCPNLYTDLSMRLGEGQ